ncbi:MAG: hypothetical protein QF877_17360 [Gammaproteobacteria bacterium]|jgi:hypothetical protein|nr:hypothetical protein [Gammaproteobacteria bacterium]
MAMFLGERSHAPHRDAEHACYIPYPQNWIVWFEYSTRLVELIACLTMIPTRRKCDKWDG